MVTISMTRLLNLAFQAATCFVPMGELTDEQLDKLENIEIKLCRPNCSSCERVRASLPNPDSRVWCHTKSLTCHVGIPQALFGDLASVDTESRAMVPAFLLQLVAAILHEIVHILFPDYSQRRVEEKTIEWLNSSRLSSIAGLRSS